MEIVWHSLEIEETFQSAESSKEGLETKEAIARLKKNGANTLPQDKPYSDIRLFFSQFNSPLIAILLLACGISFYLKHYSDAIFIVVVLFINTTVGFYQERKANRSLLALKKMVVLRARVLRDGNLKEINGEDLVVGDIIKLKAGDKVPADGRIISVKNFKVDESILTGEWKSLKKSPEVLKADTPLGNRINMVFMGTVVEEGQATALVVRTGIHTEIGKIVKLLRETKERKTPLQQKMATLSKWVSAFILFIVFLIVVIGYFTEKTFAEIFISALALAVSATPAGLLPAITVILVLGMNRIFKQNGLVRKLSASETLGSVTVICTDKTGTLTKGKMQVSHILTGSRELLSEGDGPITKEFDKNGIESHVLALKIATLANDAFIENIKDEFHDWIVRGRPTEKALIIAGAHAGLNKKELEKDYPVIDRISFDSDLKYAASLHRRDGGALVQFIGAPEVVIARSTELHIDGKKFKLDSVECKELIAKAESLTKKGLRVVACAYKEIAGESDNLVLAGQIKDLTMVGFIALKDPLRDDAKESVNITKTAGIRTVIITGDHKFTAQSIATEVGIYISDEQILEGADLDKMDDKTLIEKVKTVLLYARVSPRHKLRVVSALQENGEVVAMVGDGVNDAPAIKAADVGVSVGSGTDIAKEVADLVLLDDSFKTMTKAIEQGRVMFQNIRKVFVYLVSDDFSEIFLFLGAMIFGFPLPLLTTQILWINLVEDGFPDIALTTEQEIGDVMKEKPRSPKEPIINNSLKKWMFSIFIVNGFAAFLSYFFLWKITGDLEKTRTIVFTLMCFDSLVFSLSVRSFKKPIFRRDIFSNRILLGAIIFGLVLLLSAIYLPYLQMLLTTVPLSIFNWLIIIAISLAEIILIEFAKNKIFNPARSLKLSKV